jgi:hypothetical protein
VVVTQTYAARLGEAAGKASHGLYRPAAAYEDELNGGGAMAKYHSRPSAQYRYEHYDPR